MRNESVRSLQQRLTQSGFDAGPADGRFGARTERALRDFQRSRGLRSDGVAGRRTFGALGGSNGSNSTTGTGGTNATTGATNNNSTARGVDGVARMDQVRNGRGLATGTITVNGHTYQFNSGSGSKFSTPTGEFRVTAHRNSRSDAGFTRNGVGFSFRMEDPRRPGSDRFYDPRAGRDRSYLRIHPDGGARGTSGCLGIVGDAATLNRFRDDMNAELRRNGGSYTLRVQ
ncbi:MAG: peptidoglycan-binding domain-containing protein [Archangium sp.]